MKTLFRIVVSGVLLALAAPFHLLAQTEPIIAVDITQIAVASGNGSVIEVNVLNGGTGYTSAPTVVISGGGDVVVPAQLTAVINNGAVVGLSITNGGVGYTSLPAISFSGGQGTQATASYTGGFGPLTPNSISFTGGSGYTSPPAVTITSTSGSGASATATVSNGVVTAINVTNGGSNYNDATIVITPPGAPATAIVTGLGTLFPDPDQNESFGPIGAFFVITAEARGLFPVGGYTYQFFVNGVALGSSVNVQPPGGGPGTIGWAPPQPGAYTLTVVASGSGHTATSQPVRYFATGTAMIGPTENTIVPNGSSVVVQATATPPPSLPGASAFVSRVDFFVDGALAASDTTYPYSFIYTPAPSPMRHEIEARGYDNNGNPIEPIGSPSAKRHVNMVNPTGTPPLVRIVNPPSQGNVQAGSAVNIIADAVAPEGFIRKVEFYVNGVLLSSSQTFPFTASWTPQVPGRYEFVAVGFDDKSNAVASSPILLTATGSFPTVSIIDPPTSGFTVVQGSVLPVTVRAAGPDGGIVSLKSIELLVDGAVYDSLPKGSTTTTTTGGTTTTTAPILAEPFVFNWRTNVAVGTHRLAARVTALNNLTITSSEITVNVVANQPPQISISDPTASTAITMNVPTTITVSATDIDGTVDSVEFFVNGTSIGTATKSPFQIAWTPSAVGNFEITARATDNGGARTTSSAVRVTVDPAPASGSTQANVTHTVYRGDYGSMAENGRFALAVNRNNRATFIGYSTVPAGRSYLWTDIGINSDGTFEVRDSANQLVLSGQTSATGVSGNFSGKTFIGPVTPSSGAFSPMLVTGTLTGVPNSQVIAIVGGDGSVTIYSASGAGREVGAGVLSATGNYSFAAPTGGRLAGTVTNSASVVSGTASGAVTGTFLLRQQAGRITNISTRSLAGNADRTLVAGFVVSGSGNKPVLVRAVGPTLANFGVASPLVDPSLDIVRGSASVAANNDWGNSAALAALATQVGAFALAPGSRDAAVQASLAPGTYTAVVGGGSATLGAALIEIYDADTTTAATSRVTNISTRGQVGAGQPLIAGFVITGDLRKRVLIRAVGPTLANFGLTNLLADPRIEVLSGSTSIATNNDWTESATVTQVNATSPSVGAFPLNPNSRDAAIVLQLSPGSYTVQISGAGSSAGTVLVEIYDADL